jgi:hypothetical protein
MVNQKLPQTPTDATPGWYNRNKQNKQTNKQMHTVRSFIMPPLHRKSQLAMAHKQETRSADVEAAIIMHKTLQPPKTP